MLVNNKKNGVAEKKSPIAAMAYQYEDRLIGTIEDIHISEIFPSNNPIRNNSADVLEMADSIRKIGILSPILVRITESARFEIVAGNRRLKACKMLGWKKIPCYVVDLDEKTAFEASLIENIQRNTLSIIEEGIAFRKYVFEFGWGAASELAKKISKSSSYVSKRIRLLDLPGDVLQLICQSEISVATGEELLSIKESDNQSKLARLVADKPMSSKKLRILIKDDKCQLEDFSSICANTSDNKENIIKTFDKSIIALRIAMNNLATLLGKVEDNWILYEVLMNHKNILHQQIDLLIREKKKYIKRKHFFDLSLI